MQGTEILCSLGGTLVNVMCLFVCIVIMIIINTFVPYMLFCIHHTKNQYDLLFSTIIFTIYLMYLHLHGHIKCAI